MKAFCLLRIAYDCITFGDMAKRKSKAEQERDVAAWNEQHPEGTAVVVTKDDRSELETVTTSKAWMVGGHTAVVMVQGISGGYLLDRVRAK